MLPPVAVPAPSPVAIVSPAAYVMVPCEVLEYRAGVMGKEVTPEGLGLLLTEALKGRGFTGKGPAGVGLSMSELRFALMDFGHCFDGAGRGVKR